MLKTSIALSIACIALLYELLLTVASVPMTPILFFFVAAAAAFAPGSITPTTGTGNVLRTASRLTDDAVLQAMTSILISLAERNLVFSKEYLVTVSGERMP